MLQQLKNQSIRMQLLLYFLMISITIGGSALGILHRNRMVMEEQSKTLDYLAKISQVVMLQDENEKILSTLIIELTDENRARCNENINRTIELLEEIKEVTGSVEINLRLRVVQYLAKRLQTRSTELIWLKEFDGGNKGVDYDSSYYQVYQESIDIISRMDSYLQEMMIRSLEENKDSIGRMEQDNQRIRKVAVLSVGVIIFLAGYFYFIMSKYMTELVERIVRMTKRVASGERRESFEVTTGPKEIRELTNSYNTLLTTMEKLSREADKKAQLELQLAAEELEKVKMRELLKEAQLQGLQLQIQPHFLFNTLNVISMMAMLGDSMKVYELIIALSKFLRHSLKKESSLVPIYEEIDMICQYLYIIKARLGQQLTYQLEVDLENEERFIPLYTLQPIVENAFRHGLEDKIEPGVLHVQIKEGKESLKLRVYDNGKGMSQQELALIRKRVVGSDVRIDQEKHIGIENVASRLKILYGEQVSFLIHSKEGVGTIFTIHINR